MESSVLHSSSSILGLGAYGANNPNAQYYDAVGQFVPGMLSPGGNIIGGLKGGFSETKGLLNAGKSGEAFISGLSTIDAALDTYGLINASMGNDSETLSNSNEKFQFIRKVSQKEEKAIVDFIKKLK